MEKVYAISISLLVILVAFSIYQYIIFTERNIAATQQRMQLKNTTEQLAPNVIANKEQTVLLKQIIDILQNKTK